MLTDARVGVEFCGRSEIFGAQENFKRRRNDSSAKGLFLLQFF